MPHNRCSRATALESGPAQCRRWQRPSHYIRKGHIPSPPCPSPPDSPQLSAGPGAGQRVPWKKQSCWSEVWKASESGCDHCCVADRVRRRPQHSPAACWVGGRGGEEGGRESTEKKPAKNSVTSTAVEQIGVVSAHVLVLVSLQHSKTRALCFLH